MLAAGLGALAVLARRAGAVEKARAANGSCGRTAQRHWAVLAATFGTAASCAIRSTPVELKARSLSISTIAPSFLLLEKLAVWCVVGGW